MARRVVVIGADAAGMSAASQAKRAGGDALDVVAFERQGWTSYAACGIPYWIAGDVAGPDALIARSPEQHRARGVDVRIGTTVTGIDLSAREVAVEGPTGADRHGFDDLVVATGARPVRPPIPGIDAQGVFGIQTLDDGAAILAWLDALGGVDGSRGRAVVIGAGYIGVEMAEALQRHGLDVTVVDQAAHPMSTLDADMGDQVREAMEALGCRMVLEAVVERITVDADGRVTGVVVAGDLFPADVVVLGIGVRPETGLAVAAGVPIGEHGGLMTDDRMRVVDADGAPIPGVWAAGDCTEVHDRITGERIHVPLGTYANKQGRVLGINLGGGSARFAGVVRTAIVRVCDLEIARTGLRERDVAGLGLNAVSAVIRSTTRAGYFPGAEPMAVKAIAERGSGRLLGVQIVGRAGSAKRIDTAAVALWNRMTAADLADVDLAYAPPFSPVWDPVAIAARKVAEAARSMPAVSDRMR
jgi:NADPH-dependent 2,4-dienoyl-CoA reductase/sulfur reductase-like enzyme